MRHSGETKWHEYATEVKGPESEWHGCATVEVNMIKEYQSGVSAYVKGSEAAWSGGGALESKKRIDLASPHSGSRYGPEDFC